MIIISLVVIAISAFVTAFIFKHIGSDISYGENILLLIILFIVVTSHLLCLIFTVLRFSKIYTIRLIALDAWSLVYTSGVRRYTWPTIMFCYPAIFLPVSIAIRLCASVYYIRIGVRELPKNFRRIVICTSPMHIPEIVPGLEKTNSLYKITIFFDRRDFGSDIFSFINECAVIMPWILVFFPAWLYRLTIKSTAWFWWPLAFLSGDLQRAKNPEHFHEKVMGTLWARTSICLAIASLVAFVVANIHPSVFAKNQLLTPLGYLLLIDWQLWPWQIFAVLGAALSLVLVYLVDDAISDYRLAERQRAATLMESGAPRRSYELQNAADLRETAARKFGWIERLARLRFIIFVLFWLIVGAHGMLYLNSERCWFTLSSALQGWAETVYGERLPRPCQCMAWRFFGLEPLERLNDY